LSGKIASCKGCREKHSRNLLTGYAPTVIQATRLKDRLYYGTRETLKGELITKTRNEHPKEKEKKG